MKLQMYICTEGEWESNHNRLYIVRKISLNIRKLLRQIQATWEADFLYTIFVQMVQMVQIQKKV